MRIACERNLTLTETKKLLKALKVQGGEVKRSAFSSDTASLVDNRKRSHTLLFNSNLKLMGLI